MTKSMMLAIYNRGGVLEKELQYQGAPEEIAAQIGRDENALLEYMRTGDDHGEKSFCFAGFMFRKDIIDAAQLTEPEF
jgi:hypothetical protein